MTEPAYDILKVPGTPDPVVDPTARPDTTVWATVTATGSVTSTPATQSPQQARPTTQEDLKRLARSILYEIAFDQVSLLAEPEAIAIMTEQWAALIEDILISIFGNDHWLYAIGVDVMALQDPPEVAKKRIKQQLLAQLNLEEIKSVERALLFTSDTELLDRHEDEDDSRPVPSDQEIADVVEEARKAAEDKRWETNLRQQQVRADVPKPFPPPWWPAGQLALATIEKLRKPPASIPSNILIGRAVHHFVQQHYLATHAGGVLVMERVVYDQAKSRMGTLREMTKKGNLPIKEIGFLDFGLEVASRAAKRIGYTRARLRPDIVDFKLPMGEIYEIKSRHSVPWAVLQVYGYLYAYQGIPVAEKIPLIAGVSYTPPRYFPIVSRGSQYVIHCQRPAGLFGIVIYDVYKMSRRVQEALERARAEAAHEALMALLAIIAAILTAIFGPKILPEMGPRPQPVYPSIPGPLIDPITGAPTMTQRERAIFSAAATV